jgi:ribose-phosphate pyrophosphokinase
MGNELKVFAGNANPLLAQGICEYLKIQLGKAEVTQFNDGEIYVKICESVRGADCFVVQPTCSPVNRNLMELLLMIDALSRASAQRITAVLPYYGYARQERKSEPRVSIAAKLIANIITRAGANRVLTIDLHATQIQSFFDIPVDHLFATSVLVEYFTREVPREFVVVAPDAGGVARARAFAKRLAASLVIIDKRREVPGKAAVMNVIGEVRGKNAIIIDDIVDTGGTVISAVEALKDNGAREIYVGCTHGVLSPPAIQRIRDSQIKEVVITNTIPLGKEKAVGKIRTLSVAPLLGEAIKRTHEESSVSSLFV